MDKEITTSSKNKSEKKDRANIDLPKCYNANFSYNLLDELEKVNSKINQRYFSLIFTGSGNIKDFSNELFESTSKILLNESNVISDQGDLAELNKIESFLIEECSSLKKDVKKNKDTLSVILGNLDVINKSKQFLQIISSPNTKCTANTTTCPKKQQTLSTKQRKTAAGLSL